MLCARDLIVGVVYLWIVLFPEQASCIQVFLNKVFYREGLLAPRPTPKLEGHPLLAVRNCLFNLFAATLLIGGRSSIRNLRTRHAVVTGTTWGHGPLLLMNPNTAFCQKNWIQSERTHNKCYYVCLQSTWFSPLPFLPMLGCLNHPYLGSCFGTNL